MCSSRRWYTAHDVCLSQRCLVTVSAFSRQAAVAPLPVALWGCLCGTVVRRASHVSGLSSQIVLHNKRAPSHRVFCWVLRSFLCRGPPCCATQPVFRVAPDAGAGRGFIFSRIRRGVRFLRRAGVERVLLNMQCATWETRTEDGVPAHADSEIFQSSLTDVL